MAPPKLLRTYSRANNSAINSIEAVNILFAKNLTERKLHSKIRKGKNKIQIKELPKKIKSVLSDESSLHVNINDTFDKIFKGPQNNGSTNKMTVKIIAKNKSSSVIKHFSKVDGFSPMLSKLRSFKNRSENSEEASSLSWFKRPTLSGERITNELEIEKIEKNDKKANKSKKSSSKHLSLRDSPPLLRSRAKLPDIVVTDSSSLKKSIDKSKITKERCESREKHTESSSVLDPNLSYNPFFTNSLRERILMHSSTPLVTSKTTHFVKHPISPIKTFNDEIEDVDEEISNSILKSLEEIKSWDETFPQIEAQGNKTDTPAKLEDEGLKKESNRQLEIERNSFVTVRGRKINKMVAKEHQDNPNKTKSFNLEEFELFFNKFKTRSFKLEDFERFHNSISQQLATSNLTRSQVDKLNSISLRDFESFYTAYQEKVSMNGSSFLVKSKRTINYVTNRRHRLSLNNNKPVNLSQKYLKLSKQFDLKNLIVVLDNILVKNSTEKIKKSQSLCQTAVMNSFIQKQPVVNLTRLSIRALKAKNRLSLNGYKACRKFSSNYTPRCSNRSNVDALASSDIFDLGQLIINITRMPLTVEKSSPIIMKAKDHIASDKKEGRSFEKGSGNSMGSEKSKERVARSDSTSEKENKKSKNRKAYKSSGNNNRKSSMADLEKNHSYSSPHNKCSKSSGDKTQDTHSSSGKIRKSKIIGANRKSKPTEYEEMYSDDEKTSIKISLISESLKKSLHKKNSKKEYISKILVGSVSDTEVDVENKNNLILREISKHLRSRSQENIPRAFETKKRKSPRVLRSNSNIVANYPYTPSKNEPSTSKLTLEVSSRLYKECEADDSIKDDAQDLSTSILVSENDNKPVPHLRSLKDIVVNLTLHKSWDRYHNSSIEVPLVTRRSANLSGKSLTEKNNLSNNKTENKTKRKGTQHFNSSAPNLDISLSNTPKYKERTSRPSAIKSPGFYHHLNSTKNTSSDDDLVESSITITTPNVDFFKAPLSKWKQKGPPKLKAGKSWRRSLLVHKRESVIDLTEDLQHASSHSINSTRHPKLSQNLSTTRPSIKIVPLCDPRLSRRKTFLQTYAHANLSSILDESVTEITELTPRKCKLSLEKSLPLITAKDIVLRRCGQTKPQPFEKLYPESLLKDCKKIGEGVYGEVFLYTNPSGETTVMKVIPIEGDKMINQERQKKFDEILSEIIIASELSKLRKNSNNQTSAFSEVQRVCCVKGKYPRILLDLWEAFHDSKVSENDHPEIFEDDQLYIVLDLANAGRDLEAFVFNNALQAVSMFKQVACALAVAEQQLQFEHRDLHWGNVLLKSVDRNKKVICKHRGKVIESLTQGVEVTIIDFTLSRIVHDGVVIFNDLGLDPDLFVAEGDYQFDIYRLMKENNSNNWQTFEPYTNVLWLHYIIDKSITALRYKNVKTKLHKKNIDCLKEYKKVILNFKSVSEFVSQYY